MAARWAHNPKAVGSNPASATIYLMTWPLGQAVKTPPFHGGNRGSIPLGVTICGLIAQLGEHLPYKQGVTGSSPVGPTKFLICGPVVQLVRMPACHAGGRGFEPLPDRHFYTEGFPSG